MVWFSIYSVLWIRSNGPAQNISNLKITEYCDSNIELGKHKQKNCILKISNCRPVLTMLSQKTKKIHLAHKVTLLSKFKLPCCQISNVHAHLLYQKVTKSGHLTMDYWLTKFSICFEKNDKVLSWVHICGSAQALVEKSNIWVN